METKRWNFDSLLFFPLYTRAGLDCKLQSQNLCMLPSRMLSHFNLSVAAAGYSDKSKSPQRAHAATWAQADTDGGISRCSARL